MPKSNNWNPRIALLFAALSIVCLADESPVDIVRRALRRDNRNSALATNYAYRQKSILRLFDKNGKLRVTESSTRDISIVYGLPLPRLIEKNEKPLSAKEQEAEEARLNKVVETRKRLSEADNGKARQREENRRAKERKFLEELPQAFNFEMLGEETFGGRPVYVISAEPRPGFKPHDFNAKVLSQVRGKLWIDKSEYQYVKAEVETIGTISFGLFIARLGPGAVLTFEQKRVNDELWLPARMMVKAEARVLLIKLRQEQETLYSDYRKFQADSKIVIPDPQ